MHTLDVRFVRWDPTARQDRPVPDGTVITLLDADLFSADDVLAEGRTADGRARLSWEHRGRPDLYLRVAEPDGPVWTTRERFAEDGTPGLLNDAEWVPAGLLTFRATLDVHAAFSIWDAEAGWQPAPARLPVEVVESDPLGIETVVATGETDARGRVDLSIVDATEARPDLHLRLGPGAPPELAGWTSRDASPLGLPGQLGRWQDLAAARLGTPKHPVRFGLGPPTGRAFDGNLARAVIDGPELRDAWTAAIEAAQHTVHVEMMLFFDDDAGREVVDLLLAAADRGVQVRALVDIGTTKRIHQLVIAERFWARNLRLLDDETRAATLARYDEIAPAERVRGEVDGLMARLAAHDLVELRDTSFAMLELDPDLGPDVPEAYRDIEAELPWLTTARVDHRKILVVDGHVAVTGGQNIGREYWHAEPFDPDKTAAEEPWHKWHDVSVELRGPVVAELQLLFRERWMSEGGDAFAVVDPLGPLDPDHPTFPALEFRGGGVPVRILRTTPGAVHDFEAGFLDAVAAAKERVLVQTPYLSSHDAVAALCAAARRGVHVELFLPDGHNDSVDFHYAGRLAYPRLIAAGVQVFEYQRRMNHSKVAVVDEHSWIGSANLNQTSFSKHYEVVAVIEDAAFTAGFVAELFDVDRPRSRRIRADETEARLDIRDVAKVYLEQVVWRLA